MTTDEKNDDGDELEDLDAMLENMDIDNDFNVWTSFRNSFTGGKPKSSAAAGDDEANDQAAAVANDFSKLEESERSKWRQRLDRTEVYSRRYKPSAAEQKELLELEKFLGLSGNFFTSLFGGVAAAASGLSSLDTSFERENWDRLVHPTESSQPHSVILKRGPVLVEQASSVDDRQESELILLTHGLVVASVPADSADSKSSSSASHKKVVLRQFERAILWDRVDHVCPSSTITNAFELHLKPLNDNNSSNTLVRIICSTAAARTSWLEALQLVLVNARLHSGKAPTNHGWQYQLVQYPPQFAMAVTGSVMLMSPAEMKKQNPNLDWNELDTYHGYAPLHYAVRYGHVHAVQALLQAGAHHSPKDSSDHHTPMYFAQRDGAPRAILQALESAGAKKEKVEMDPASNLFGKVAETQQLMDDRREQRAEEERQKAESAQAQMAENMRLLQERGEQIEELGDKATQLNDNAKTFADMAAELKEKSKKQSKWLPF